MDRTKTIEKLNDLAVATDGRSESARLGDVISEVEAALRAGVKRQIVLETLHQNYGFKMSMSGFEKALRRIRKKMDNKEGEASKKGKENNTISQQLIATSTIVPKPTVTDTVSSKNFISPGDIKNQRIKGIEEAIKLQEEIENINYEENQ
jgi:hypothetical protein